MLNFPQPLLVFALVAAFGCGNQEPQTSHSPEAEPSRPNEIEVQNIGNRNFEWPNPDDPWDTELFGKCKAPLKNVPNVLSTDRSGRYVNIVLRNNGATTLEYCSAGPDNIQCYIEVQKAGAWKRLGYDWCGTGKSDFEILPGHEVELRVKNSKSEERYRISGLFTEKGTDRSGHVVLVTF